MGKSPLPAVLLAAAVVACGGESARDEPSPTCALPVAPATCDAYEEADVRPLVYACSDRKDGPVVPPGSYWEPTGTDALLWFEPCSTSLAKAHESALLWAAQTTSEKLTLTFVAESVTPYFFQVSFASDDGNKQTVIQYRRTRCDYFDGTALAGAPFDAVAPLDNLAGYLWFKEIHSQRALLAMLHPSAAPQLQTVMCHARVHNELLDNGGMCESVELLQTDFVMEPESGTVTISPAQSVRMFPAECH